jgi:hypothetical protein
MLKLFLALSVAAGSLGLAAHSTGSGQAAPLVAQATPAGSKPVTFLRDVAPILNKVGCTAGT